MHSPTMQVQFTSYVRKQAQTYALLLTPLILVSVVCIALIYTTQEERDPELLQACCLLGLPTLVQGIFVLLTRKNEALTELTAAAMLISFTLILVLVNTTSMVVEEMSADLRAQQIFMLILIYFIISLFVSASWLWGFAARSLFTLPTVTILMLNQSAHDDEIRFGQEWASAALIFLFIETSTYINMKAKAELFVRIAHSEQ